MSLQPTLSGRTFVRPLLARRWMPFRSSERILWKHALLNTIFQVRVLKFVSLVKVLFIDGDRIYIWVVHAQRRPCWLSNKTWWFFLHSLNYLINFHSITFLTTKESLSSASQGIQYDRTHTEVNPVTHVNDRLLISRIFLIQWEIRVTVAAIKLT